MVLIIEIFEGEKGSNKLKLKDNNIYIANIVDIIIPINNKDENLSLMENLKNSFGKDFQLVTPGIRPSFAEKGDQRRVMTPEDAIRAGSDYLVIGRPITQAKDPIKALELIHQELGL